jgi:hypothetical protein
MKIYVAGPMRGIRDFNFPAFHQAAFQLRMLGHEVFNPAEKDEEQYGTDIGKSETGDEAEAEAKGFSLREALAMDLDWICRHADAIYMLRGWENSKGAAAEHATAIALGLEVMYQEDEPEAACVVGNELVRDVQVAPAIANFDMVH